MSAAVTPNTAHRHAWLLAWLPAMLVSIFVHGPMPLYSTRTLAVGWDMWRLGEWLVPHINGAPYSHKTPLLYWLYHAGWAVTGVNDIWPRLLHLAIATVAIALAAALARQLFEGRERLARLVPWILAGVAFFALYALQLMFDVLLGVFVLMALLALVRGGLSRGRPHWPLFALAVWLGLMTKGPVMLLHVAFPLLLAPSWHPAARAFPARWYRGGVLALLAGVVAFAAWVVPAAMLGGDAYRETLLVEQTAGRVVASFDHARVLTYYLETLPVILFPWLLWPAFWRAQWAARAQWREPGLRFLALWLLPVFIVFSLISGKQVYYLVPEVLGFAIAMAALIDAARDHVVPPRRAIGFGIGYALFGLVVIALPQLADRFDPNGIWSGAGHPIRLVWGGAIVLLGLSLLRATEDWGNALRRLAVVTFAVMLFAHLEFRAVAGQRYDVGPASAVLAQAVRDGRPIANLSSYEGQFHFAGRLDTRIAEMQFDAGRLWALQNPDGVIVQYPQQRWRGGGGQPLLVQPFRATWLEIWNARDWLAAFHSHLLRLPLDVAQRSLAYPDAVREAQSAEQPDDEASPPREPRQDAESPR
jgi:4-amino-4-deoxy-L-arabinose transferase-like glycosyltransferase